MNQKGFSLIELIVVISIIALLSVIGAVAYNRVQMNARDSKRLRDMDQLRNALLVYKSLNGTFPVNSDPDCHGWDTSFDSNFISPLNNPQYIEEIPKDPLNTTSIACDGHGNNGYNYFYYRYTPATLNSAWGCPSRSFIILGAGSMETSVGTHPKSPGFTCPGSASVTDPRDWHETMDYVIQIYE